MQQRTLCLTALLGLLPWPALGQGLTAAIRGTVTDQTRAVIAGAEVTVRGEATGFTRLARTNSAGIYSFTDLPVGSYVIEATFPGFKSRALRNIVLSVADVRPVDLELAPGEIQEQISVEADALQVKTIGGEVAGVINGEQVRELPLNGRNFLQLALLMPGVSPDDSVNLKDKGILSLVNISVSGGAMNANLWTVDGANNNDVGSNNNILVSPSVDAIEQFKVHRNSYGAEYGQAGGAQIDIVTRSGTNQVHGSVYYFGRNEALDATNYFLVQAGQPKDRLRYHDFGFTFGGPIVKDKLHFFFSQEWNRNERGTVRTSFVPTEAERTGDFSGPAIPGCTSPPPVDPLTGEPFPGNRIPVDRQSPGGLLFLQLYPLPNTRPTEGTCNNWVTSLNTPIHWRQESLRVDWNPGNRTRLMLRYTQDHWSNNSPNDNGRLWGDDPFPAVDSNWEQPGRSLVLQLTRNLGSTAVNSLQFSYSANRITVTRGGTNPGLNGQINAAIPSVFSQDLKEYGSDIGHPVFWGGGGYEALWNEAPFRNNQDLFILKDDYSAVFGKHFVKAGVLASSNKKNEDTIGNGSAENSGFWGSTGLLGSNATTGNILADFVLKDMTFGFAESSSQHQAPERWKDLEFYVADSWKVRPRLTIDFGVRYSHLPNPYTADDRLASFDPALFDPALGADPCNGLLEVPGTDACRTAGFAGGTPGPNRALVKNEAALLAPRLGVAWDVYGTGKTAVRLGLGQFFLRERLSPLLALTSNPPFSGSESGIRRLDTNVEPCEGCFTANGGSPGSGREVKGLVPNNWQWNVTLEHQLWRNTTLEVSYVGNRGLHLPRIVDVNQVGPGDGNGNGVPDRLDYVRSFGDPAALAALRPFGVFGDVGINRFENSGSSIYHALQAQLLSRFGHGSQFQASYTWSRLIDNLLDGRSTVGDSQNPALDRGLSPLSRKHMFNASLVLGLPGLEGRSGFVRQAFGDWEVATILAASSGQPLTIFTGDVPEVGGVSGNQRPNRVSGQPCRATSGPPQQWLNPDAFTLTGFELGTFGDAGRGICEGPGIFQVDLALYKNFKVGKKTRLQVRAEVFNVFNQTQFLGVNTCMCPTSVTLDAPLESATGITGFELPATFGQATGARDARQAQFGVKLIF